MKLHLSVSLLSTLLFTISPVTLEAEPFQDSAMPPTLGGGQIYRTHARPVNTGGSRTGVQIERGRVLLTHNGGRWVQDEVHVANIAELGKQRPSATALVTVVPHRFPSKPPQNLMAVSGDRWFEAAESKYQDEVVHTYSPPAELVPHQNRKRPTTSAVAPKDKKRRKGKVLSGFFSSIFARTN
ncbi:MAG: hypothetical protein AAGH89_13330 [Verrucomicrobiota bacterium]